MSLAIAKVMIIVDKTRIIINKLFSTSYPSKPMITQKEINPIDNVEIFCKMRKENTSIFLLTDESANDDLAIRLRSIAAITIVKI